MQLMQDIGSECQRRMLLRGLLTALPGIALLFLFGTIAPLDVLEKWGAIVFPTALLSLGWGLIPYRTLQKTLATPKKVDFLTEHIEWEGKVVAYSDIERVSYRKGWPTYGLVIKARGNRLFLPFFTERQHAQCRAYVAARRGETPRQLEGV